MTRVRIFKVKWFTRFARRERIPDQALVEGIERAENGLVDPDLGGHLIKQRVAREGKVRSGGYRTIIVFKSGSRSFFVYGFAMSDQSNLSPEDEANYKAAAKRLLSLSNELLAQLVEDGTLTEVDPDD